MSGSRAVPTVLASAIRVFNVSIGQMLWSFRSFFLAILVGAPVVIAAALRLATFSNATFVVNGRRPSGSEVFGTIVWLVYVRFVVPVLGVFYGTSLIADEVDDKTITYLFARPIPRRSVLLGKYAAYLVCTTLLVLPSLVLVYLLIVPISGGSIGREFPALAGDLAMVGVGLAVYGALFAYVGASVRRPLIAGLVFSLGWEPFILLFPGYLKRLTVAYYLQALVKHDMPIDSSASAIIQAVYEVPGLGSSLVWLALILGLTLWLGCRSLDKREYVLEQ